MKASLSNGFEAKIGRMKRPGRSEGAAFQSEALPVGKKGEAVGTMEPETC